MSKRKVSQVPQAPDLDAIMKVFDVVEAEAREYEHRTGNQLCAVYLRERLLPKMWAAFGAT